MSDKCKPVCSVIVVPQERPSWDEKRDPDSGKLYYENPMTHEELENIPMDEENYLWGLSSKPEQTPLPLLDDNNKPYLELDRKKKSSFDSDDKYFEKHRRERKSPSNQGSFDGGKRKSRKKKRKRKRKTHCKYLKRKRRKTHYKRKKTRR